MSHMEIRRTNRPVGIENAIQPGVRLLCWEIQLVEPITLCTKCFEEKSGLPTPFRCLRETIIFSRRF